MQLVEAEHLAGGGVHATLRHETQAPLKTTQWYLMSPEFTNAMYPVYHGDMDTFQ